MSANSPTGAVRTWLRVEGLAVLVVSLVLYGHAGFRWGVFALCLPAPDLAMVFYLLGTRAGTMGYNVAHNYVLPLSLAVAALLSGRNVLLGAAFIWTAHIGMDRALGYGLKYSTSFQDTHLGRIGKTSMPQDAEA
jgi:hypothetical protein